MNEQRKAFEAWYVPLYGSVSLLGDSDQYTSGYAQGKWQAWQAAIASQAPRQALTDAEIANFWKESGKHGGDTTGEMVKHFARAIEAASGPNAALVEFVKLIAKSCSEPLNSIVVYKDKQSRIDKMTELRAMARAALAAVGVEP